MKITLFLLIVLSALPVVAQRRNHHLRVKVNIQAQTPNSLNGDTNTLEVAVTESMIAQPVLPVGYLDSTNQNFTSIASGPEVFTTSKRFQYPASEVDTKNVADRKTPFQILSLVPAKSLHRAPQQIMDIKKVNTFGDALLMVLLILASLFVIAGIVFLLLVTCAGFLGVYISLMYAFIGTALSTALAAFVVYFIVLATT